MAGNAKINQKDVILERQHNISGIEITKNDRRVLCMQIIKDTAQLQRNIYNSCKWYVSNCIFCVIYIGFKCPAVDEIHHKIPPTGVTEVVIDMRKVLMIQTGKHLCFTFEILYCFPICLPLR